ncbi:uncharacterized protein BXZ73DRAFT_77248 [Epithele typhae]|uniref:uncharacterized protein n=1 Tax=Epithele typhae TaxID=378194 RepID=UPI0020089BFA|nr:uncharacterized protein BXZ73DRAFT_77248 [Epithele typhae]KAH9933631.1 hypothetical protein BXZ73DRAFT_77248 [Epithele typhae]
MEKVLTEPGCKVRRKGVGTDPADQNLDAGHRGVQEVPKRSMERGEARRASAARGWLGEIVVRVAVMERLCGWSWLRRRWFGTMGAMRAWLARSVRISAPARSRARSVRDTIVCESESVHHFKPPRASPVLHTFALSTLAMAPSHTSSKLRPRRCCSECSKNRRAVFLEPAHTPTESKSRVPGAHDLSRCRQAPANTRQHIGPPAYPYPCEHEEQG